MMMIVMMMMMMIRKQIVEISKQGEKFQMVGGKPVGQGFELGTINNKSS